MKNDSNYMIPYIRTKSKYLAVKKWIEVNKQHDGNIQKGGITTKSGLYAIFYNKNEFAYILKLAKKTDEQIGIGVTKTTLFGKTFESFPSVDKIRMFMGSNAFFVKEGSNTAKPVLEIEIMYKILKFINSDYLYNVIAFLLNKIKKTNHNIESLKKLANKPFKNEATFEPPLRFDKSTAQNKKEFQRVATELNNQLNVKINAVAIIEINRLTENERIAQFDLDPVPVDFDLISNEDIKSMNDVVATIGDDKKNSATTILNADADNKTSDDPKLGGFFQIILNENELVGGNKSPLVLFEAFETLILALVMIFARHPELNTKYGTHLQSAKNIHEITKETLKLTK